VKGKVVRMERIQFRWDAVLSHPSHDHCDVGTFTFAETHRDAIARMESMIAENPDVWEGWTFKVAPLPSPLSV
jgi:hypothetical protein